MKSLLIRFFISFWLIIGITIGSASLAGYWYAERMRDAYDNFDMGDAMLDASAALASAGRDGLIVWLNSYVEARGTSVLVLDRTGRDLLNRPIPRSLIRIMERQRRLSPPPNGERRDPDNVRRARPLSQLIGPDGARYTFVLVPARDGPLSFRGVPPPGILLILAVIVSAVASYLLARAMSRPVRQLSSATKSLADGDFNIRVASSVVERRDELGILARDFDSMAGNLQRSVAQQVELSRNVSHELRSPLARLRVALELARRKTGELPELDRIDHETECIDKLIAQMLSYSRLDVVAKQDKNSTCLNDLVADVVDDVNFECESEGLRGKFVRLEMTERITMLLHGESIKSAVENIMRNAVRHTRANSDVQVELHVRKGGGAVVVVDDEGSGVRNEDIDKLFEPFFRTEHLTENRAGTGLGLAIAKRAVEIHGGTISASNRPSGGLRISIELPVFGTG